jgi:hypothetical protein
LEKAYGKLIAPFFSTTGTMLAAVVSTFGPMM